MIKEEIWSVSIHRARDFFRQLSGIEQISANSFQYGSCFITLAELRPRGMGVWAAKRIQVRMEGNEEDVEQVYHRFFIQFLSTGG